MTNLNTILLSLKKSLAVRGSNIDEVIDDFDRRHTGLISTIQFQRLVSSCGIYLPPKEYDLILKSFSASNNTVNLNQFSNAVKNSHEEIRSIGDIMRDNLIDLHKRLSQRNASLRDVLQPYDRNNRGLINKYDFLRAVGSFPSSQAISEAFSKDGIIYLSELLQEYEKISKKPNIHEGSNQFQTTPNTIQPKSKPIALENAFRQAIQRDIDLRESFFAIDRLQTGKMSQFHFQMALSNTGLQLTPNDTTSITRYYQCDYDLIDYLRFLRDAEQYRQSHTKSSQNLNSNLAQQSINISELMRRISITLFQRKVHPSQFFPPKTTLLTKPQFSSALRQSGLGLSAREIDAIGSHFEYENDKSYVNVQLFESQIQSSIMSLSSSTIKPSFSLTGVRQRVPNRVDTVAVMKRLSASLAAKKVQLAPRFQRFDRENSGEFNVSLVNAVISNLGIQPLSAEELEAIQTVYAGNVYPCIKWRPFAASVDPQIEEQKKGAISEPIVRNERVQSEGPPASIVQALLYVKKTADRNALNLLSEFRSLDRMRVGFLYPSVFSSFMMREFPRLDSQSIAQLLARYGGSEFRYVEFCRDIERSGQITPEKVEVSKGIERDSESAEKGARLSHQNEKKFRDLLRRLKAFCTLRMLPPLEIFSQEDINNLGFIRTDHLQRCFTMLQFPIEKDEIELIVNMCADPNNPERVFYRPLARDIENTKIEPGRAKWILNEKEMKKDSEINAKKVVSQIQDKLKMRNRRVTMLFAGAMPNVLMGRDEFASRIRSANIIVQGDDLNDLVGRYKRDTDENGAELVDWESFVHDVESYRFFE